MIFTSINPPNQPGDFSGLLDQFGVVLRLDDVLRQGKDPVFPLDEGFDDWVVLHQHADRGNHLLIGVSLNLEDRDLSNFIIGVVRVQGKLSEQLRTGDGPGRR